MQRFPNLANFASWVVKIRSATNVQTIFCWRALSLFRNRVHTKENAFHMLTSWNERAERVKNVLNKFSFHDAKFKESFLHLSCLRFWFMSQKVEHAFQRVICMTSIVFNMSAECANWRILQAFDWLVTGEAVPWGCQAFRGWELKQKCQMESSSKLLIRVTSLT